MSPNTYFRHPSHHDRVFKTCEPVVRRRLKTQGWFKVRREDLDRMFGRWAMADLSLDADGEYQLVTARGLPRSFVPVMSNPAAHLR